MYNDNLLGGFILVAYSFARLSRVVPVGQTCQPARDGLVKLII